MKGAEKDCGADARVATVHVRYNTSSSAEKCASELVEVRGLPVTARVLEGEEEKAYWNRLLEIWGAADKSKAKGGRRGRRKGSRSRSRDRRDRDRGRQDRSWDDRGKGKGKG